MDRLMRNWFKASLLAGTILGCGHAAHAYCPTPNPNINAPPFVDNCPLPAASLNAISGAVGLANTAAMELAQTGQYAHGVIRLTDGAAGAPPLYYTSVSTACTLNGGAGDGGSQIPAAASTGCWIANFTQPVDVREWGAVSWTTAGYNTTPVDPAGEPDDTTTLQYALNTGLNLYMPPGRYHVTNGLNCGGAAQQFHGAGKGQSFFDAGSDFNLSTSGVFNISPGAAQGQMGCELYDLGFQFYQNPADVTTSQLIHYPWAIIATTPATRNILENINIARGWNGISFNGNYAPIMNGIIQIGAFNTPFLIDGPEDYTFVNNMEIWPFGNENAPNLSNDIWFNNPPTAILGYTDGIKFNSLALFTANLTVSTDANYVTGAQIGNLHLNGNLGQLTMNNGSLMIANLSADTNGNAITVNGAYDSTYLLIGNCKCITSSSTGYIENEGGILTINGGVFNDAYNGASTTPPIQVSGASRTNLANLEVHLIVGMNENYNIISQTGANAGLHIDGLHVNTGNPGYTNGDIIAIGTDNIYNHLDNIDIITRPNVSIALNSSGMQGYYNLPGITFPISVTPTFVNPGNLTTGTTLVSSGFYELLGYQVYVSFDVQFTPTYTSASGNFSLELNTPVANTSPSSPGVNVPCALGAVSNVVTLTTGVVQGLGLELNYTNPIQLFPDQFQKGTTWSILGPTQIPSGNAMEFRGFCTYTIR